MSSTQAPSLILFELVNPSDPYTFYAPSVQIAGIVAYSLAPGFGAKAVGQDLSTPVFLGWDEWMQSHGIDDDFAEQHRSEIADAFDSFVIGTAARRADVESMLARLPESERQAWRDERQDRHRSSESKIGEVAYEYAKRLREAIAVDSE